MGHTIRPPKQNTTLMQFLTDRPFNESISRTMKSKAELFGGLPVPEHLGAGQRAGVLAPLPRTHLDIRRYFSTHHAAED
jgi:hypothetical protein